LTQRGKNPSLACKRREGKRKRDDVGKEKRGSLTRVVSMNATSSQEVLRGESTKHGSNIKIEGEGRKNDSVTVPNEKRG